MLRSCAVYFTTLFNLARRIPPDAAPEDESLGGSSADGRRTIQVLLFVAVAADRTCAREQRCSWHSQPACGRGLGSEGQSAERGRASHHGL